MRISCDVARVSRHERLACELTTALLLLPGSHASKSVPLQVEWIATDLAEIKSAALSGEDSPNKRSAASTSADDTSTVSSEPPPPRCPSRPSVDTLGPEVLVPNHSVADESDPLSASELEVMSEIRTWLGEAFERVPFDLLLAFVRGYAYRRDWSQASFAFLERCLMWRRKVGCDAVIANGFDAFGGAPRRAEFDTLLPSGPIGRDKYGHIVTLERFCQAPVAKVMNSFTDDEFLTHFVARREALRALTVANSLQQGRRVYKVISVVDVSGMSLGHTRRDFIGRMKRFNELFASHYPETTYKLCIINAPRIFTVAWALGKSFLHPLTVSKVHIVGGSYEKLFKELGVVLDPSVSRGMSGGKLPKRLPTWSEALAALRVQHAPEVLARGYTSEAERMAIKRLSAAEAEAEIEMVRTDLESASSRSKSGVA